MALSVLDHRAALGVGDGRLYVDGTWREGSEGETWAHVHPASNEEVGRFAVASKADVTEAVAAARRVFDDDRGPWRAMGARDRSRLLQQAAALIAEHADTW